MSTGLERVQSALGPLLLPLALPWRLAIARRNARFDRGVGVRRLPVPVISVGNLSAGGTGKTPVVRRLARTLQEAGVRPAIALRGYAAGADGRSDEAMEYEDLLPGVPVVVGADRFAAVSARLEAAGRGEGLAFDTVLLDDGFQHRRLARDLDLVLVDATRPFTRDRLLPAGRLREPASSLARADAVIVTRSGGRPDPADRHADLAAAIERHHGGPPIAWTDHAWRGLEHVAGPAPATVTPASANDEGPPVATAASPIALAALEGARVGLVAGTGHPEAVAASVRVRGGDVVWTHAAGDHARYARGELATLARAAADAGAAMLVVTRKDWVKLRPTEGTAPVDSGPDGGLALPVVVPDLAIEIVAGAAALEARLLAAVRSRRTSDDRTSPETEA